jgi:hypothetical protein
MFDVLTPENPGPIDFENTVRHLKQYSQHLDPGDKRCLTELYQNTDEILTVALFFQPNIGRCIH